MFDDPVTRSYKKKMRKLDKMDLDKIKPVSEGHRKDIEFMKRVQARRLAKRMGVARLVNPIAGAVGAIFTPKPAGQGSALYGPGSDKKKRNR